MGKPLEEFPPHENPEEVYDRLNHLWIPLAPFRLKIAALVKEGYEEYPVGELIRIMKEILDS